jgi:hypothetical protein
MTVRRQRDEQNRKAVEEWTRKLETEIANYRALQQRNFWRALARCGVIALVVYLVFQGVSWWWIVFFLGGATAADVASGARTELARALSRARDPRAVSALAAACVMGDPETKRICEQGLISLLPSLRADEREFVTDDGMKHLISLLASSLNGPLVIAILRSLEQVGDARAVRAVQQLSQGMRQIGSLVVEAEHNDEVRRAAEHCLPYLQATAERDRLRDLLLRPAVSTEDNKKLLRPAGFAPSDSPEQLLRPAPVEKASVAEIDDQPVVGELHVRGQL